MHCSADLRQLFDGDVGGAVGVPRQFQLRREGLPEGVLVDLDDPPGTAVGPNLLNQVANLDVVHDLSIPFLLGTLHSDRELFPGLKELHLAVVHTGIDAFGLQVALVAGVLVVRILNDFARDEAVLVGPEGHVAEQQVDDLHDPSIPFPRGTLHSGHAPTRQFDAEELVGRAPVAMTCRGENLTRSRPPEFRDDLDKEVATKPSLDAGAADLERRALPDAERSQLEDLCFGRGVSLHDLSIPFRGGTLHGVQRTTLRIF